MCGCCDFRERDVGGFAFGSVVSSCMAGYFLSGRNVLFMRVM